MSTDTESKEHEAHKAHKADDAQEPPKAPSHGDEVPYSGRGLHPDARARHEERVRQAKSKPLFNLGGKMPDRSDEVPYTGETTATSHTTNINNLDAVAEHLFNKGHAMGYQLASTGSYERADANGDGGAQQAHSVPGSVHASPSQPTPPPPPPPRRQSTAKGPPIGSSGGQVGGVISDATDTQDAQSMDYGKANNNANAGTQAYKRPSIPQRSFHETQATAELGEQHDPNETQNQTGQIGGRMHNQWLDSPETKEKYANPDERIHSLWYIVRERFREPLAEFLASMVFIMIGTGASVQTLIYQTSPTAAYTNMVWCWGIAVMAAVYLSGGVSGGHANPALTLALAIFRGFPWKMVPQYWFAQILGMFVGSLLVYAMYNEAIAVFDPAKSVAATGSAALFVTFPATSLSSVGLCVFQTICNAAILTAVVFALGDADNSPPGASLGALILAFVIMALGSSLGSLSGYPMNPARDLAPRFALSCVGYGGSELWSHDRLWWLTGPIAGSILGVILGGTAYDALVYSGLGSPLNMTTAQVKRLVAHKMAKPGIDKQRRDDERRNMHANANSKGDKAV